jgi:broad specificity phosphatase PhoE
MLRIILIRPGSTDFDEQRRIKGTLDIPLNQNGADQVSRTASELVDAEVQVVYCAPCQSAMQTAQAVAERLNVKVKRLDVLRNLDHGLWHGKLIDEVKRMQPKVYRLWQDSPEAVCPPEGETLTSAKLRVQKALKRLRKKHRQGVVAVVASEPLASIMRCCIEQRELGDLWKSECDFGAWEMIDVLAPAEAPV